MELVIITGMSGAGKSTASGALEDLGYYCVDNIPPRIIPSFIDLSLRGEAKLDRMAIVCDLRGGEMFKDITNVLDSIKSEDVCVKVLFLETEEKELVRRYKESRRSHPLFGQELATVGDAVAAEKEMLVSIRSRADIIIDTTFLSAFQLKSRITDLFSNRFGESLNIHCMTFGFKYGAVGEADLVFDMRCLPNPFYVSELRPLTGEDKQVQEYVFSQSSAVDFAEKLMAFIDTAVPLYIKEGKSDLVIAFGCTGGMHRSVAMAVKVSEHLKEAGYKVSLNHRDILKNHR